MMRRLAALVLMAVFAVPAARAEEWVPIGPAAVGQGGAGVAAAQGPGMTYWNPALPGLGKMEGMFDLGATFGLGIGVTSTLSAEGDVVKEGDEVFDLIETTNFDAIQARLNAGTASVADVQTAMRVIDELNDLNEDEQGLYSVSGGAVELRLGCLTFFGHSRLFAGADPIVDFSTGGSSSLSTGGVGALFDTDGGGPDTGPLAETAVAPAARAIPLRDALVAAGFTTNQANALATEADTALGAAVADPALVSAVQSVGAATIAGSGGLAANQTGFDLKALNTREFGVGIAVPVVPLRLSFGAAFKGIQAETSWTRLIAVDTQGEDYEEEVKEALDKNREVSTAPSLDLGVAWSPVDEVRFGLTGKDVLGAEFDLKNRNDEIKLDPQVRFGAAWRPAEWIQFAADADLVENDTDLLPGYHSRLVGGGLGLRIPFLDPVVAPIVRAGVMKNVASSESEITYTGGFGFDFGKVVRLAVAGAYAPDDVVIESGSNGSEEEIPQRVSVAAELGISWEW